MPNEASNVDESEEGISDLVEEVTIDEVALAPAETGDPVSIVEAKIPADVRERYEVYSYRNAAAILCETRKEDFEDLLKALRAFKITKKMIRTAGGNESEIPKLFSGTLRPLGWYETVVQGDLLVKLIWREQVGIVKRGKKEGNPILGQKTREFRREKYLDGHKIDYVKNRVAFDLEWNSKDQTFDRDLYAFRAFFECGVIDAAVLVTRSKSLDPVFRSLGQALKKDGVTPDFKSPGVPRLTHEKYGASTTWVGKLLYRLNAGRNGGCPVLVIGITPKCVEDWTPAESETPS